MTYKPARIWASCIVESKSRELLCAEWHDDDEAVMECDVEYVRADLVAPDIANGERL